MTQPKRITSEQARIWLTQADAPTIVDVRTPAEFAAEHLAGSVNIPLDLVQQHAEQIARAATGEVLLVCRTDNRATQAADLLAPNLGERIHVLVGGISSWAERGGEVTQGNGRTWAMDRQVRATAGALALTGVLASTVVPKAKWLAGGIGAGLLYSGASGTCAMASALAKAPWNTRGTPSLAQATAALASKGA
ncbi:rhodanese-like domain-containing protein [Gephyromycinifex aptenodytis]|uniref:rhodanese-like domain-containing protein n=1 Tax=Gephyromycinifex aptenodytis TaxID=2716227 RepID=UPI0014457C2E|nr:rhodanese-like domain-containing protein [Gephyromycinifex aptenodytis]